MVVEHESRNRLRRLRVELRDRQQLAAHYLSEPPYGGLAVEFDEPLAPNELVELEVHAPWLEPLTIRGAVLWCRRQAGSGVVAGVGFLPVEVEKRERLLHGLNRLQVRRDRQQQRFHTTMRVTYRTATDFVVDYARNISTGGVFVASTNPPGLGERVLLKLYPPGHTDPIDLSGHVAWRRPGEGFGVRFDGSCETSRERLARLVRGLAVGDGNEVSAPHFEEVTPF